MNATALAVLQRKTAFYGAVLVVGFATGGVLACAMTGKVTADSHTVLASHLNAVLGCFWLLALAFTLPMLRFGEKGLRRLVLVTVIPNYGNWAVTLFKAFLRVAGVGLTGQGNNDLVFGLLDVFVVGMIRTASLAAMVVAATGCFAGYDSRWGQSAAVQRQHAAQNTPTLRGEHAPEDKDAPAASKAKTLRVRAFITHAYTTQVADVPGTLRELFADVNDVMEPALGVRLELEGIRTWDRDFAPGASKDDDLAKVLAELGRTEPGTDVDWVAGFVGALPRVTASFHDLGYGDLPGRHIVLRAPSSAQQHDAVERSYAALSEEERRRLQKDHRRHRIAATFLHEIGHTLGALHERSERNLMYPEYRAKMTTFGPEATEIMRGVLAKRDSKSNADQATLFRGIAAGARRAAPGVFFEEERQKLAPQLEAYAANIEASLRANEAATAAPAAATPAKEPEAAPPELSAPDQSRYLRAKDALARNEHVAAWELGKPLYAAYPNVLAVQDLRCTLATSVFRFDVARRECERLMKLSTSAR